MISSKNFDNNKLHGILNLEGIERAKKGIPKICVKFEFNENRVLKVTAEDKKTRSIIKAILNIP